jgi:hypothetical protein
MGVRRRIAPFYAPMLCAMANKVSRGEALRFIRPVAASAVSQVPAIGSIPNRRSRADEARSAAEDG